MRRAALALLLVACGSARPELRDKVDRDPRPRGESFYCSARLSWDALPSGGVIQELEARCRGWAKPKSPVPETLAECPCTELGVALGHRRATADRVRGLVVLIEACEGGSIEGCDAFELARALCLQAPEEAECSVLRERRLIPTRPFPLEQALGCRAVVDQIVCVRRDRYFIRSSNGTWDQLLVRGFRREDTRSEPRWVATLPGGELVLSQSGIVKHAFAQLWVQGSASPVAAIDPDAWQASLVPLPQTRAVAVGPYRKLSAAELEDATRAIRTLPRVESSCSHARACLLAIEKSSKPAQPVDPEGEAPEQPSLTGNASEWVSSLLECQALERRALAELAKEKLNPPPACARAARE